MATDVITLITKDHRTVESLFDRLKKGEGDTKATVAELHALLVAHARAEEDRVYPGIDAHHGVEEHKEAEVLLDALVRATPGTPEFRTTLDKLVESVQHHVEEEENDLLPQLRKSADDKRLQELGRAFEERRNAELKALGAAPTAGEATKAELYEQAQRADIPGRSQMDKEELAEALKRADS
ncbi:hemerythrin domain-containing protein [Nonomuraea wenchangensis]